MTSTYVLFIQWQRLCPLSKILTMIHVRSFVLGLVGNWDSVLQNE
jgi:hypothetical protein